MSMNKEELIDRLLAYAEAVLEDPFADREALTEDVVNDFLYPVRSNGQIVPTN